MNRIWKFPLVITDVQPVLMPLGATILTAQVQRGELQLWAMCDPEAELDARVIVIFGTGHSVPTQHQYKYIATVQTEGGDLVWHVFEVTAA